MGHWSRVRRSRPLVLQGLEERAFLGEVERWCADNKYRYTDDDQACAAACGKRVVTTPSPPGRGMYNADRRHARRMDARHLTDAPHCTVLYGDVGRWGACTRAPPQGDSWHSVGCALW